MAKIKGLWAPIASQYKSMYGGPWCPTEGIYEKVSFIYNGQNYTYFQFIQRVDSRFAGGYEILYTPIAELQYGSEIVWRAAGQESNYDRPDPVTLPIYTEYLLLDFGEEQEVSDAFEDFLRNELGMAPVEGVNFSVPFEYLLKAGEASRKCGCGNITMSSLDEKILEIYEKGKADALANQ